METVSIMMEIKRSRHRLHSVSVVMPTWNRIGSDGKIYAKIPFLGLETYGTDEEDLRVAIEEALECFCIAAEEHGLGLESELQFQGWKQVEKTGDDLSILNAMPETEAMKSVLSTGDIRAIEHVFA